MLTVTRQVVAEMVTLAAGEPVGVLRVGPGGPRWRRPFAGRAVRVSERGGVLHVRVVIVARPGVSLPALTAAVHADVRGVVERLLGLQLADLTVVVDGVG